MAITALLLLAAYLLGSIPSSVWIGKRYYGVDVREHGSRNAGTTNVLRVLGRRAAIPVFALDMGKGFAAVMLFHLSPFRSNPDVVFYVKLALVVAVVLGHIFPVFAKFKGGKGVATLFGSVMAVYPPGVLLCFATFLLIFLLTNYVSLSSVIAGSLFPVYTRFVFGETYTPLIIFGCVVAVLLIYTHRKNLKRLLNGTESKIYIFTYKKRKNAAAGNKDSGDMMCP